jgi:hypothetical protein
MTDETKMADVPPPPLLEDLKWYNWRVPLPRRLTGARPSALDVADVDLVAWLELRRRTQTNPSWSHFWIVELAPCHSIFPFDAAYRNAPVAGRGPLKEPSHLKLRGLVGVCCIAVPFARMLQRRGSTLVILSSQ